MERPKSKTLVRVRPAFRGFPKGGQAFFRDLAEEMSREWFQDNKARYDALWVQPMSALLEGVSAQLASTYKPVGLAPKVLRIHRDVRFSKDKTPYKTHIGGVVTLAGKTLAEEGTAAIYVHLGLGEQFVGAGSHRFGPERLARWRKAVGGGPGEALGRIVTKLRGAGYKVSGHDDFKNVPRGFDPDHPRAEFLRMRGLTALVPRLAGGLPGKAEFLGWMAEHGKAMAPLVIWLHENVR